MGRFRAKAVKVRKIDDVTIIFQGPRSIWVGWNGNWSIFHRWGAPLGSYDNGWRQFRHLLYYEKHPDIWHIYKLADKFDIPYVAAKKEPDFIKSKV